MSAAKLDKLELNLLQQLQPSSHKTLPAHKRFVKALVKEPGMYEKAFASLKKGGWIEEQGEVWVPTDKGLLALMTGGR